MPKQERNVIINRAFSILQILRENHRNGLTLNEIHKELSEQIGKISKKTVSRDISFLVDCEYIEAKPENTKQDEGGWRWKLADSVLKQKIPDLTTDEMISMYVAKGILSPLIKTPFYSGISSLFKKIENYLGPALAEYLDELVPDISFDSSTQWGIGIDSDIVESILQSLRGNRLAEMTYLLPEDNKVHKRVIGPHFITFMKGNFYLIAENTEKKSIRTYAISRIKSYKVTKKAYNGDIVQPSEHFKNSFGIYRGTNIEKIELEFNRDVSHFVSERRWHSSQVNQMREDGTLNMSMEVAITSELEYWILGFGPAVKVISPQFLIDKIVEKSQATIEQYVLK